jgi:hypothetical protein
MHEPTKYKYPPMERPPGSGIWGRPALDDNLKHLARYNLKTDVWTTWCKQEVPSDHKCPPVGRKPDGSPGPVPTCWACDFEYRRERGLPVRDDHPHLASLTRGVREFVDSVLS